MGLIMDSGSVMDQLQQMNQNLSQALDKLTLYEQEINHFIQAKDQLVSEAYDGLRSRYEQLHLPLIKGFKNCFQAQIDENNRYQGYIAGTLRIPYVDEDGIREELFGIRMKRAEMEQRISEPGGFRFIGYLGFYEQIEWELDQKLKQVEHFISKCSGLYQGIDVYQSYIREGLECLGSVLQNPDMNAVPAVMNLKWAIALQEIGASDIKDLEKSPEVDATRTNYITKQILVDLGWSTDSLYLNENMIEELNAMLNKYDITEPEQIYHFLSQVMKESDNWYIKGFGDGVIELGSDAYITRRYEGRKDLGNIQEGDGILFKGAGYLHLTGRSNYTAFYNYMKSQGLDDPSILTKGYKTISTKYAWESAAWYWSIARPLNTTSLQRGSDVTKIVNDDGEMVTVTGNSIVFDVTKLVNGGTNGIADRIKFYNLVKEKLNFKMEDI